MCIWSNSLRDNIIYYINYYEITTSIELYRCESHIWAYMHVRLIDDSPGSVYKWLN